MSDHLNSFGETNAGERPRTGADPDALRILVVDDNPGMGHLLRMLLGRLGGHVVRTAHDGESALIAGAEFRPEVVLLDLGLPDMDGREVARRIRAEAGAGPFIAALTAHGSRADRETSLAAGFDEHLAKPVSLADLELLLQHPKLQGRISPVPTPDEETSAARETTSSRPVAERLRESLRELAHELGNTIVPLQIMLELLNRPGDDAGKLGAARDLLEQHIPQMQQFLAAIRRIQNEI